MEDWYKVTREDIYKHGGSGLLVNHYNSSVASVLQSVYPQHKWLLWRFKQLPLGYWESPSNQTAYLDWLRTQLEHSSLEDWYKVTEEDIRKHGGSELLSNYNNSASV